MADEPNQEGVPSGVAQPLECSSAEQRPLPRTMVIINPTGGGGKASKWIQPLRTKINSLYTTGASSSERQASAGMGGNPRVSVPLEELQERGTQDGVVPTSFFSFEETMAPKDAMRLGRAAVEFGYEVVVVVGGDGTLSEVVNGMYGFLTEAQLQARRHSTGEEETEIGKSLGVEEGGGESTLLCRASSAHPVLAECPTINGIDPGAATGGTTAHRIVPPHVLYGVAGTGGDFSRLGLSCTTVEQTVNTLLHFRQTPSLRVDVGFSRYLEAKATKFFINVTSIGLGSEVCSRADRMKKKMGCCGGKAVFFLASFVELVSMKHRYLSIRPFDAEGHPISPRAVLQEGEGGTSTSKKVDDDNGDENDSSKSLRGSASPGTSRPGSGRPIASGDTALVNVSGGDVGEPSPPSQGLPGACVDIPPQGVDAGWYHTHVTAAAFCNGQYFGGGMKVSPYSDPHDQLLNLTLWREKFCGFLTGIRSVYNGKHLDWKSTSTMQAPLFEVRATKAQESSSIGLEADGELGGSLPVMIGIAGGLLFVPPFDTASE